LGVCIIVPDTKKAYHLLVETLKMLSVEQALDGLGATTSTSFEHPPVATVGAQVVFRLACRPAYTTHGPSYLILIFVFVCAVMCVHNNVPVP
jgi:hypothetical protein